MLFPHVQRFTARHEHLETGALAQQLRQAGCRGSHLLEVVEDQQQALLAQLPGQLAEQRLVACLGQTDGARDRREHRLGVADGREIDEEHPVLESVVMVGSGAERQSGLADAAGSGEGEQPDRLVLEERSDLVQLGGSAHENRRLVGKLAGSAGERHERREEVRSAG